MTAAAAAQSALIGAAGVPRDLGETRDYDRIFAELAASRVTLFYPVFQYVEAPEARSLGHEIDFIPPCAADAPAFAAMRRHGVRLIAPSNLLYSPHAPLPPMAQDPLAALIACAGPGTVYGVLSYDEPAHNGVTPAAAEALYDRVKAVAPDMPVLMVHAPLVLEAGRHDTDAARGRYLEAVAALSRHADIVGFSTYPIPPYVAKMGSPSSGDAVVDHATAAMDYMAWLAAAVPGKRRMAVLQNFSYVHQYDPAILPTVAPPEVIAAVGAPSAVELDEMARLSIAGGAEVLIWYGAGFTPKAADRSWRDTLAVSKALGKAP